MAGLECHAQKYGLSLVGNREPWKFCTQAKDIHGQRVICSLLSFSPVGDHTTTNTNKQNPQKELEEVLDVLFMN